jgi:photosystem II stability/assembly factor-like uncharacterized protein
VRFSKLVAAATSPARKSPARNFLARDFLAQSVTFISGHDGWLLGAARCPTGWCTALRGTTDRGHRWTSLAAPRAPLSENAQGGVSELRFADQADGFAFGPGLWVTHDGAAHWHEVRLPGAVMALAPGQRWVYAVVVPCWPFTGSCITAAALYRTAAGVDAWQQVTTLPSNQGAQLVVSGSAVFMLGEKSSGTFLLGSRNGAAFTSIADPCSPERTGSRYWPVDLAASTAADLAVLCGGSVAVGSQKKMLFVSSDGGRSYDQTGMPPYHGDIGELAAASATRFVMTSASGASWISRTSGADRTWATPLCFRDGGVGFADLGFTDPSHGAVIHGSAEQALSISGKSVPPAQLGALYLTSDGGVTWSRATVAS